MREVERRAEQAEGAAGRERQRAQAAEEIALEIDAEWRAAAAEAVVASEAADATVQATDGAAEPAGLTEEHASHRAQMWTDPDAAGAALDVTAARRLSQLRNLGEAAAAADHAKRKVELAEGRQREAEDAHESRRLEASAAADDAERAGADFADAVDAWIGGLSPHLRTLAPGATHDGESLGSEVLAATLSQDAAAGAARAAAAAQLAPAHAEIRSRRSEIEAEKARLTDHRADLADQLERVEAEILDAPPPIPGRPAARPPGFAPLWACVDFAAHLSERDRAGLEASLLASGLLDAVVTAAGELLSPDTLDTAIDGKPVDDGLAAWLVPAADGPVDVPAVVAALASIGRGAESGADCWVALDGRWANGPLHGRWSQPEALYIGAATRANARSRRMADLRERIANLDGQLVAQFEAAVALDAFEADAFAAAERFPSTVELRDAILATRRADAAALEAAAALSTMARRVGEARSEAGDLLAALAAAEKAARCRADVAGDAIDSVNEYRVWLSRAVAAVREAARARAASMSLETRAADAKARAVGGARDAERVEGEARTARGEADELRRTVGSDVEAVLARQVALEDELRSVADERRALNDSRDEARDRLAGAKARLQGTEEQRAARDQDRTKALSAQARLAATELAALAVGAVDPDRDLFQVTAGLTFARYAFDRLRHVEVDPKSQDAVTNRLHAAFTSLRSLLAADFDPHLDTSDGLSLCVARLGGQLVGASELERALAEEVDRRRTILSEEERDVIERHLLTEVGTHLGERVHAAWSLVDKMNEQLAAHPTRSGVSLRLSWEPGAEGGPSSVEGLRLLRRDIKLLTATERATLAAFLAERVRAGRDHAEGADVVERLTAALDYRRWHRFVVHRRGGAGAEQFTARTQAFGSGGEQAKLAHLPLFAAMAGYYRSARPTAPHLLVLDEAFAGIDDDQRGDCMAMLVELDLDPVLANFGEWGCYPEVPHIAVYHLERTPGAPGVAALRFVWDGRELSEDDPFLDLGATSVAGDEVSLLS